MAKTLLGVSGATAVGGKNQYLITTKEETEVFVSDWKQSF